MSGRARCVRQRSNFFPLSDVDCNLYTLCCLMLLADSTHLRFLTSLAASTRLRCLALLVASSTLRCLMLIIAAFTTESWDRCRL